MTIHVGNFMTSPRFMELAQQAATAAITEAHAAGLPKAYSERAKPTASITKDERAETAKVPARGL